MSRWLLDTGLIRVTIRYVKALKPDGPLFYDRRIPKHAQPHYGGKGRFRKSLKTRDIHEAARKAAKLAKEHDSLWRSLGSKEGQRAALTTPENRDAARALLASFSLQPGALSSGAPREVGHEPSDILDAYLERTHGDAYLRARHEPERTPRITA